MAKAYFTLCIQEPGCNWSPEFGDYDRATVAEEMANEKDSRFRGTKFKIIKTAENQAAITAAVDALNS